MLTVLAVVFAVALAAAPQDAPAQAPPPHATVSLDRIRRGLQHRPTLRISAPPPEPATFKVTIVEHPFFREAPHQWDWGGGGVPITGSGGPAASPALAQVDVLPMLKSAKHAYDEHAASKEVEQTFAEFCATHACR